MRVWLCVYVVTWEAIDELLDLMKMSASARVAPAAVTSTFTSDPSRILQQQTVSASSNGACSSRRLVDGSEWWAVSNS